MPTHRFALRAALPFVISLSLFPSLASAQGGRGGGPGGGNQERAVVAQFDAGQGRPAQRRGADRGAAVPGHAAGGGRGGFGGRARRGQSGAGDSGREADAGRREELSRARRSTTRRTLRTFFVEFEKRRLGSGDGGVQQHRRRDSGERSRWTARRIADVGVHFRGNSSFGVGNGYKRSLNLTFDWVTEDQAVERISHAEFSQRQRAMPTFLRTVLSMHIARQYIAAPKANLVRVVINGENWGVYANAQQFNKDFLEDNFKTNNGTRWKVPQGGGGGIGGFSYVGDDASQLSRHVQHQVEGRTRGVGAP